MLTALVLGVFIPIVQATTGTANEVRNRVVVDVYVNDDATAAERQELRHALRAHEQRQVRGLHLQGGGPQAAPRRRTPRPSRKAPSCWAATRCPTPSGWFPRTRAGERDRRPARARAMPRRARVPSLAGIDEVRNKESDTDKILSATGLVKILTAGLAALLIFASIALVANTIRLSIFARRREVEVMKLVGRHQLVHPVAVRDRGGDRGLHGRRSRRAAADDRQGDLHRPARRPASPCWRRRTRSTSALLIVVLMVACMAVSAHRQRAHAAPLPARLTRGRPARAAHYPCGWAARSGPFAWARSRQILIAVRRRPAAARGWHLAGRTPRDAARVRCATRW